MRKSKPFRDMLQSLPAGAVEKPQAGLHPAAQPEITDHKTNISDGGNSENVLPQGLRPAWRQGNTWFTQEAIPQGDYIVIQVNGKVTIEYIDDKNTYTKGYLAVQQHHQGSIAKFRNPRVKTAPLMSRGTHSETVASTHLAVASDDGSFRIDWLGYSRPVWP
jgi:hypothetical protein